MSRAAETVEGRAVKIAARVMQAAGLCRFEDVSRCRTYVDASTCDSWPAFMPCVTWDIRPM